MSDYLWDKSGDTDTDVDHLETLLGDARLKRDEFGFPPHLALPARRKQRTDWMRFAAAACALVAVGTSIWFASHREALERGGDARTISKRVEANTETATPANASNAEVASDDPLPSTRSSETPQISLIMSKTTRSQALATHRKYARNGGFKRKKESRLLIEEVAVDPLLRKGTDRVESNDSQQVVADLMLALHISSRQLNVAQRKVNEDRFSQPLSPERGER